jgi:uncharacterized membrane protein
MKREQGSVVITLLTWIAIASIAVLATGCGLRVETYRLDERQEMTRQNDKAWYCALFYCAGDKTEGLK